MRYYLLEYILRDIILLEKGVRSMSSKFGLNMSEIEFLQKRGISTFGQLREAVSATRNDTSVNEVSASIFAKVLQATMPAI